jgi:hypothetical protein
MIADWILRVLGSDPVQFSDADKWPTIFGILSYYTVPYGQILLVLLSFVGVYLYYRKFTKKTVLIAIAIGAVLALLAYLLDQWLLIYGQSAVYKAINGM